MRARVVAWGLVLAVAVAGAAVAGTGAGSLDPSFGTNGKVRTSFAGRGASVNAIALQSDGKVVAAGRAGGDFALARYLPNGDLDPSFGSGGEVVTDISGSYDAASGVALQPDGKIVVAGNAYSPTSDFALARYMPNGDLDPSFGSGGEVVTEIGGGYDAASGLAIQGDGKIVAAGRAGHGFALARYRRNGQLDPSFGSGGRVQTGFARHAFAKAIAIQRNGKIVVAGERIGRRASPREKFRRGLFALVRYDENGMLDRDFGARGKVSTRFARGRGACKSGANAVALQHDGKIVAAGYLATNDHTGPCSNRRGRRWSAFALARYERNGQLDRAFGSRGRAFVWGPNAAARAVTIQRDGKIVAAGGAAIGSRDFLLARLRGGRA